MFLLFDIDVLNNMIMKKSVASKEYQLWWEANQERILAQDKLRHEMDYKQALAKHMKKKINNSYQISCIPGMQFVV
jgi:hypothetical protein